VTVASYLRRYGSHQKLTLLTASVITVPLPAINRQFFTFLTLFPVVLPLSRFSSK
jgi:hypothetical protein